MREPSLQQAHVAHAIDARAVRQQVCGGTPGYTLGGSHSPVKRIPGSHPPSCRCRTSNSLSSTTARRAPARHPAAKETSMGLQEEVITRSHLRRRGHRGCGARPLAQRYGPPGWGGQQYSGTLSQGGRTRLACQTLPCHAIRGMG